MAKTLGILGLLVLTACSSGGSTGTATPAAQRSSRNLITRAEIESSNVQDAYEVVQRLRPEYLREQRGNPSISSGPQYAAVYVDGVRRGGPEALRGLRPVEVEEIRFISASDATTRWGTGHGGGVIEVKIRSGRGG
jgi:hypothetical protein